MLRREALRDVSRFLLDLGRWFDPTNDFFGRLFSWMEDSLGSTFEVDSSLREFELPFKDVMLPELYKDLELPPALELDLGMIQNV